MTVESARRQHPVRDFYGAVMSAAERRQLRHAATMQGFDEEIAVLRVKLRTALDERPEDLALMLRGIDLLVKAASARYRLSPQAENNLAESIAGVIRGAQGLLLPEGGP